MLGDQNITVHSHHDSGTNYIFLFIKSAYVRLASLLGAEFLMNAEHSLYRKVLTSWQYNPKVDFLIEEILNEHVRLLKRTRWMSQFHTANIFF